MISIKTTWNEFKGSTPGIMLMGAFATAAGAGAYQMVSTMSNDPAKALAAGVATAVGLAITSSFVGHPAR